MAGEPVLTICGNLTSEPELRFLSSGAAVASFTVACTPRVKKGDEWSDGDTVFYRCSAWRQQAENVTETLVKGSRVLVHGKFKVREYDKDGQARQSIEIDVEHVGPELRYATAKINKVGRSGGDTSGGFEDAWSTAPAAGTLEDAPF
jgi:single-strand DNA-binding protein